MSENKEVNNKVCPDCGGKMFMATITRSCVVEVIAPEKEGEESCYKILKENENKYDINVIMCARCRKELSEEELVTGVKCVECGKIVSPNDVDEKGVCDVCNAKHQRAELQNASREDLIKMLLDAERKANPVASKIEKQIQKATEVEVPADQTVAEEIPSEQTTEETSDVKPTKRAKAPRGKKAKEVVEDADTSVTEESVTTEVPAEEPTESVEAVNDLANQQEAPFPEMNLPEESTPTPVVETPVAEEPIGAPGFQMFDDGDEPF